jgi:hypothetical protein
MRFQTVIDRLDDGSGELALALAKLQLQQTRGLTCEDEEADFIEDLFAAAQRKEIRPIKVRGAQSASAAALLLVGSGLLPLIAEVPESALIGLRIAAALAFVYATYAMVTCTRLQTVLDQRHEKIRAALGAGASLAELALSPDLEFP